MRYNPANDGIDHINVYSRGKTELGRMLSNFYVAPFALPDDGMFKTVEGYWYWLSCHDDRLRSTDGFESKALGRRLRAADWPRTSNFKDKIRAAIQAKVTAHEEIAEALRKSVLPFAHYYVYGTTVRNVPNADWILEYLEQLRRES